MSEHEVRDRNLALDSVRVSELAALAAARWMGRGDERAADQAAAAAMKEALNVLDIDGVIVIGEGDRDASPLLYVGEPVGTGKGPKLDIALDPLEGTTITAKGGPNAIACLAMAPHGGFLNAPDTIYMDKIAVGGGLPPGTIDINDSAADNLGRLADVKGVRIEDLVVCILDRPRHDRLIADVRASGARIRLIGDGDVAGVIATSRPGSGIDIYMGSGGAPEGVLAAAALRCIGGQFQGRLLIRNDEERARARSFGIEDPERVYGIDDLAKGDVTFTATGVTDGTMLKGVRRMGGRLFTESIVMRSKTGTVRLIEAEHNLVRKSASVPHFDH